MLFILLQGHGHATGLSTSPGSTNPSEPIKVAVYCGKGVTAGYLWHAYPLEKSRVKVVLFTEREAEMLHGVDVISFPSGGYYRQHISPKGLERIKHLVRDRGVGFLGTCGGNVFGCELGLLDAGLILSEKGYPYGVQISGFPEMAVTDRGHPAMNRADGTIRPFYYWGQVFERCGPDVKVLATYRDFRNCHAFDGRPYEGTAHLPMLNKPGIISGHYGKGRVILSGPHPEIGEADLYVHWIDYLSGKGEKTVGAQKPMRHKDVRTGDNPSQQTNDALLSQMKQRIRDLMKRLQPHEAQIRPYYQERWERGVTIGLPVLVIFLDTCHRLESIRGSMASLDPRLYENEFARGKLLQIKARSEKEMMPALRQVEALLPELDKTMTRLKEMDLIAWERRKILHMNGSFYPETYYQLISDLKTSNVPLVKMEYLLHGLRFHGLLD